MPRWKKYTVLSSALLLLVTSLGAVLYLSLGSGRREIVRTTEKELKVNLQAAFGKVHLSRGDPKKICTVDIRESDQEKAKGVLSYTVSGGVGALDLDLSKYGRSDFGDERDDHFDFKDLEAGKWY
ncbi:MAG: hypothetical protein AABZ61_12200, partial [Bacteroidota bacterium]